MSNRVFTVLGLVALATATTGCATHRWVRNQTDPISQQVSELDKKSADNARKIGDLDDKTGRDISRVNEKADAADTHAGAAAKTASEALAKGGQAIEKADGARTLAESGIARTGQLEKYVQNLDNFQMSSAKTVYFDFNKSLLTDDAKKDLDQLAQALSAGKKYVVEVQGFTDTIGSADYNYSLSEKRAAAVVRYLTEQHKVPVYRVHTIGLGKDMPAEAPDRREARKLSRRVELKVYTVAEPGQTTQQASE
jgi:OOP family OmpA-OmpF porin